MNKVIVAVDCFCVREPVKGVARMAMNFVRHLETAPSGWSFVLLGVQGPAWNSLPVPARVQVELWPKQVRRSIWYRVVLPRLLRKAQPDLVHGLADYLPRIGRVPAVLTVTEDPARRVVSGTKGALRGFEFVRYFQLSLKRSYSVLAISTSVAQEIQKNYGYRPDRIDLAYLGVDLDLQSARPAEPPFERFFLTFASGDEREQWPLVLEAFAQVRRERPELVLAAVGGTTAPPTEAPGVIHLGRVTDDFLAGLYRHAVALVDVSRFEGFGLQVLEACHFRTPVIACDLPTVAEIAGPSAVTHRQPDADWLANQMLRIDDNREQFLSKPQIGTGWQSFINAAWGAYARALAQE